MGFAAPGLTEEQDGPVLLDEPQCGQVLDEFSVQRGLELKVEVGQCPSEREPGKAQSGGQLPVDGGRCLLADDPGQELDMAPLPGLGLFGQGGEALGRTVQTQVAEVVFQLFIKGVGHDPAPAS